jgi:hypothetical protein
MVVALPVTGTVAALSATVTIPNLKAGAATPANA